MFVCMYEFGQELELMDQSEQPKHPAKRVASEQADLEGRKSGFGSRKVSNPTLIAAHS